MNTAQLFFFHHHLKPSSPFFPHRIDYYHSFLSQLLKLPFFFLNSQQRLYRRKKKIEAILFHFQLTPVEIVPSSAFCTAARLPAMELRAQFAVKKQQCQESVQMLCPPPISRTHTHSHRVAMPLGGLHPHSSECVALHPLVSIPALPPHPPCISTALLQHSAHRCLQENNLLLLHTEALCWEDGPQLSI